MQEEEEEDGSHANLRPHEGRTQTRTPGSRVGGVLTAGERSPREEGHENGSRPGAGASIPPAHSHRGAGEGESMKKNGAENRQQDSRFKYPKLH